MFNISMSLTGRRCVLVSFALFSLLFLAGLKLWFSQSEQWRQYQLGWLAYRASQYQMAVDYFDQSYENYQRLRFSTDPSTPPASLELAELAMHFKGLALVKQGTEGGAKLAVLAFKEALKLTTVYELDASGLNLSRSTVRKLEADRNITKQDLEILFHNQPQKAQKEGKGRGDKGEKGDKQSEDPSKGNAAGKEDRNKL